MAVVGVRTADLAAGWGVAHGDQPGGHRITTYGVAPLSGTGALLTVTVEGRDSRPTDVTIGIDGLANEGRIPLKPRVRLERPRP
jgi:hypothetical protein